MDLAQQQLERFQGLLRDLFQFDCADLDFGIYRIMNHKRDIIDGFISTDLPNHIEQELAKDEHERHAHNTDELNQVTKEIHKYLGPNAIGPDGEISPAMRDSPLAKRYNQLRKTASSAIETSEQKIRIFNHLNSFFSRYFQDGDFVSKRRYSRKQRYAIPYNGEEVFLYWVNHDQYYIKTGERFNHYKIRIQDVTVIFTLADATVEQNNVKGSRRFFFVLPNNISLDEPTQTITIPFSYRPLIDREESMYGTRNQQDTIITQSIPKILDTLASSDWTRPTMMQGDSSHSATNSATILEYHIRRYTRRNTSDFFIHKNLKGFLTRELDFYLKNEVLKLDDLVDLDQSRTVAACQLVASIRAVATKIIDFLHQIETFQKLLWEKRKFIINSHYCISLRCVDAKFYPVIARCEPQWEEWKTLLHVDDKQKNIFNTEGRTCLENRIQIMRQNPSMLIDSKYYDQEFIDKILETFDDIDGITDGILFHSDNFQALNLLIEKYRQGIDLIYIDPPYNSKSSEILYKNSYKHSSWLSLMDSRLSLSHSLLTPDGTMIVAIDENEQERLGQLLRMHFTSHEIVCVSIVHNKKGIQGRYFSYNHDFAYFCMPQTLPQLNGRTLPESKWKYDNLRKWGRESKRSTAKNCFYPILVKGDEIIGFGDVCEENYHPDTCNATDPDSPDVVRIYPVDSSGVERKWRYARTSIEAIRHLLRVHRTSAGEVQILKAKNKLNFKTVWDDTRYIAGDYGTRWLTDLGLKLSEDLFPKSIHTVEDSITAVSRDDAIVLDYFAGSGTTGHAVINLNRNNKESIRKFILVEMGEYFTTVTLPRIKKIAYCAEWKNGMPKRAATSEEVTAGPRIIRYASVESYEDSLNNISFDNSIPSQSALEFDDYVLTYMLKWESRSSQALLNIELLDNPFSYSIHVQSNGETQNVVADLPETFNFLAGIQVRTRRVLQDGGTRYLVYRGQIEGRNVVVIWRTTRGWTRPEFERDSEFVVSNQLTAGVDEILVNGDSFIPGAKSLEALFKSRMFGDNWG